MALAVVGAVVLALAAPGTASAACGPSVKNNPCVYLHHFSGPVTTTGSSLNISSFDIPASSECANPALVVMVSMMKDSGSVSQLSSVTWTVGGNTQNLAQAVTKTTDPFNDTGRKRIEIWYRPSPNTGTGGTVAANVSGGNSAQMVGGVVLACGVDQSSTLIASTGTNGHNANPHTTLNSAVGALLLDVVSVDGDISTVTPNNNESSTWDGNTGTLSSNVRGASANKSSTASSEDPDWTLTATTYWVIGAMTLKPWTPTAVGLESFDARSYDGGTVLAWHTGREASNLGYRVYREVNGQRVRVNRDVIAGSGLSFGGVALQAGYSYSWFDPDGRPGDVYWLEDVEIGGESAWHGPFTAEAGTGRAPRVARSRMLGQALRTQSARRAPAPSLRGYTGSAVMAQSAATAASAGVRRGGGRLRPGSDTGVVRVVRNGREQWELAAAGAAKIEVTAPGWYRVGFQQLAAAGFEVSDPGRLQLFADGVEQAIRVVDTSADSGPTVSAIEFFGVPEDTPSSGSRIYWLVEGSRPGLRMGERTASGGADATVTTVPFTVEVRERLGYIPGLLNGDRENFFGQAITADPAVESVPVDHLASFGGQGGRLQVALQGFTQDSFAVDVAVNGTPVGKVELSGAEWRQATLQVPSSALREGDNTVTLSRGDETSIALVDSLRLTYPRTTSAGDGQVALTFPASRAGKAVRLDGFTTANIRIVDISNPARPTELSASTGRAGASYYADVAVPALGRSATLLAFTDEQAAQPARIVVDTPSSWHTAAHAADMVVIGPPDLLDAADSLRAFHEQQGLAVEMVDVQDIYDEFSFGAKSPAALRSFLKRTREVWSEAPRYVLLLGDGSYDPRDYLGFDEDLVPTKLIDTDKFETASDDWFADFNDDGIPEMAVGRLPVGSVAETRAVVEKIVSRESAGVALDSVLLVADVAKGDNFTLINQRLANVLPPGAAVDSVNEDDMGAEAARELVLDAINLGVDFVSYSGHGTVDRWRGDVLTTQDAANLKNGHTLSVFTMMNCLNGVFQEPLLEGLGEALIRAPEGGAAAVWASSATTTSSQQELMVDAFYRNLALQGGATLGEAATAAKSATDDLNVRRTWVLLGDPAMKVGGAQ